MHVVDEDGPNHPDGRRAQAVVRLCELMGAANDRMMADPRSALAEVERLAVDFAGDPEIRTLIEAVRAALSMTIGPAFAEVPALQPIFDDVGRLARGQADPILGLMPGFLEALRAQQNGDSEAARTLFAETLALAQGLPDDNPMRQQLADLAPMAELMMALETPGYDTADRDHLIGVLRESAARPGRTDGERALLLVAAGGAALNEGKERDLGRINEGIDDLRAAVTLTEGQPEHVFNLGSLALAMYHRSDVRGSMADVDEAIALLERARDVAGGVDHPHWSFICEMLADFGRRRGEILSSSPDVLDALRGYAWQVLLQPTAGSARTLAASAAEEAMKVAARCLSEREPGSALRALRALDGGRGLMLFAATELRDPYTRLVDAGEKELADRWRAEENPSVLLREEVIGALSRDVDLLDPPTLEEVQEALRRLGADALVYLVPAASSALGWAVIAPVEGTPRYLPLPGLAIEEGTEIERYLAAAAVRDAAVRDAAPRSGLRDVASPEEAGFAERLDALCEWAWKGAMGRIVEPYLAGAPDRTPRLVLVPMGDLARVPWQAARRPDGTYLLELAAISQAASARMLCASAAAEPVRHTATGLVVADPDTGGAAPDLPSARLEAYAIYRTFYPAATYIGRRPDGSVSSSGAGTPDQVRTWLRAHGSHAGRMVHFATHGIMQTDAASASSRLLLADGTLDADDLIRLLDTDRHPISLAVLAGCHTGQSIHGYDEAYSLGTVLLAAGARSVLSTQWSIPDRDTSLLMYMFHHWLIAEGCQPWDALRQAQLWMLDGERQPPRNMPAPLRRLLADADPGRIVAWAGFVHSGQ
ncbi:CHAT domain-containing protein [Kribbella sp. NBC_00482]|uniref:CHAT domain-containing protein n=1 Tax=Kribbella sp. NBC_00482 TaxID=2975968 RepID=UPI002E172DAE